MPTPLDEGLTHVRLEGHIEVSRSPGSYESRGNGGGQSQVPQVLTDFCDPRTAQNHLTPGESLPALVYCRMARPSPGHHHDLR